MLPRDSRNHVHRLKIFGFENALEDCLPDPRDIDRLYTIENAYRQNILDLADALEQTCKIIMISPALLEAFIDIPRRGYSFDLFFDKSFNLWLHLVMDEGEPIQRCLGGGVDSDKCLLSLPQYIDVTAEILEKMEKSGKGTASLDELGLKSLHRESNGHGHSLVIGEDTPTPVALDPNDGDLNDIKEVEDSLCIYSSSADEELQK